MTDYLLDAAWEHLEAILRLYGEFEEKRPVMLYDMQEERIYAYPYAEFSAELSKRSQQSLKRLVSYSIDNEQALLD